MIWNLICRAIAVSTVVAVSACGTTHGMVQDFNSALTAVGVTGKTTNAGGFNTYNPVNTNLNN